MPQKKPASTRKKQSKPTKRQQKKPKLTLVQRARAAAVWPYYTVRARISNFLKRRPHRSFRRTRRRDYARSLELPGYWAFTNYVRKTLAGQRKLFVTLAIIYAIVTALTIGIASQDTYVTLTNTLRDTSSQIFEGDMGRIQEAGLLFLTAVTGGLSRELEPQQQVYAWIVGLLTWLTTVWLLRSILAGRTVRLRDGLYSAGAPIVATAIVALVVLVQLLPLALALIGYAAATASGLLVNGGVEAMLFWVAFGLLAILSLYWITSSLVALVIVTLPGMYPFQALRIAGDLVVGRRLRILLRLVWLAVTLIAVWAVIMIPIILLDTWIKGIWDAIYWLPVIPTAILLLTTWSVIWSASYVYLLYRKVVDDDADPA